MFKPTNIHVSLIKERKKGVQSEDIIVWVQSIFNEIKTTKQPVLERLSASPINRTVNVFDIDEVDSNAIFHISHIEKICVNYRLRFLDTKYFKGSYPKIVVDKIQDLEQTHNTVLDGFKIIAPSKLFRLDKADDPLLFAPMGNGYYYLIHKWGTDLHPLRKIKYWGVKNVENLGISIFLVSLSFHISNKKSYLRRTNHVGIFLCYFYFMLKAI